LFWHDQQTSLLIYPKKRFPWVRRGGQVQAKYQKKKGGITRRNPYSRHEAETFPHWAGVGKALRQSAGDQKRKILRDSDFRDWKTGSWGRKSRDGLAMHSRKLKGRSTDLRDTALKALCLSERDPPIQRLRGESSDIDGPSHSSQREILTFWGGGRKKKPKNASSTPERHKSVGTPLEKSLSWPMKGGHRKKGMSRRDHGWVKSEEKGGEAIP